MNLMWIAMLMTIYKVLLICGTIDIPGNCNREKGKAEKDGKE